MALRRCKECGNEISSRAESCPHCGAKAKKKTSLFTWMVLAIFIFAFVGVITGDRDASTSKSSSVNKPKAQKPSMTAAQKQAKEKKLLGELKTIPSDEVYMNLSRYEELMEMFPGNNRYTNKYSHYKQKVKELEGRIGKMPPAGWGGVPFAVERIVKKSAHDPDSIDFDRCSKPRFSDNGWSVTCTYRGNNAFGGKVLEKKKFTIRHNAVISAEDA